MKCIAVFCGSSTGTDGIYRHQAEQLGEILAGQNIHIVYGGGKVGLMGILADSALNHGGRVTGIIPRFLDLREVVHPSLTQLIRVDSMHRRKALIGEMSDGAIALPGGFGTMDELFEMLTWGQLGLHRKPVGVLNVNGYFQGLISTVENMVREGFLKAMNRDMLLISEDIHELLSMMDDYVAPDEPKWL